MAWNYSSMVESIEASNYEECKAHSKKYGIDGVEDKRDCKDLPCYHDCPFN